MPHSTCAHSNVKQKTYFIATLSQGAHCMINDILCRNNQSVHHTPSVYRFSATFGLVNILARRPTRRSLCTRSIQVCTRTLYPHCMIIHVGCSTTWTQFHFGRTRRDVIRVAGCVSIGELCFVCARCPSELFLFERYQLLVA
jgi:hypothetical protein